MEPAYERWVGGGLICMQRTSGEFEMGCECYCRIIRAIFCCLRITSSVSSHLERERDIISQQKSLSFKAIGQKAPLELLTDGVV